MTTKSQNEVLLFAFEYPPLSGGIARLCSEIGGGLARNHVTARVLTEGQQESSSRAELPEFRVQPQRPVREWLAFQWLRRQKRKTSAFPQTTICGIWYPEALIACLAGVGPLVILAHGAELLPPVNRWRRPLWKILQRFVLEKACLVIANSDYTSRLVSSVAPKAQVNTIALAVDSDRFAPGDREAAKAKFGVQDKRVLCTVSRIHPYKGHDTVLRALANLAFEERDQLIYLIAGTGPHEQETRRLAIELGIESHVRWLGFVPENELPLVYQASDLFVLCTRDAPEQRSVEGFGLVFLEAQACATPVVGTRTGGIPAAIREGEGGWLIEQDDDQKLTEIVRQLVHSPELFRAAGVQARRRVIRESTWERYGQSLWSALHNAGLVQASMTGQVPEGGRLPAEGESL